jgi:short-subunit dehydrogenase
LVGRVRFAKENFAVALLARSADKLEAVANEIKQVNVRGPFLSTGCAGR